MINVLIDTNILRQDPQRKTAAFKLLNKMGRTGELVLHIPYFVKEEFLSQRKAEYSGALKEAERILKKVSKKHMDESLKDSFKEQVTTLQTSIHRVDEWLDQEFAFWCRNIGAKKYLIHAHHGEHVAKAYFSGTPPFKKPKARDDIPDAFIFETVKDVLSDVETLFIVTGDKQLRKGCGQLKNAIVYSSLDEFIKSEQCHEALIEVDIVDKFDEICEALNQNKREVQGEASKLLFDELVGYTFNDPSIPDDNNQARISMLDVPSNIGLDIEAAEYYGSGVIEIPFKFKMPVVADYYIFKPDYYVLDEKRAEGISVIEYDNRHYFEAEENLDVEVCGKIVITLDLSSVTKGKNIIEYLDDIIESTVIEISKISDVSVIQN